jgi:site-specific DNA recombinase
MRKLLVNPVLAGLRVHRGEVVGDGAWEPLISRAEHERLLAMFGDKAARRRTGRGRKFLLSGGLLICGECEAELYSGRRGNGTAVYVCRTDAGGCGKVQIQAEPLELLIRGAVVEALAGPKLAKLLAEREDADVDRLARSLHEDEEELKALATLKGQRRFTLAEWLALRDPIEERIAAIRAELQASSVGDVLADLHPHPSRAGAGVRDRRAPGPGQGAVSRLAAGPRPPGPQPDHGRLSQAGRP